MPAGGACGSRQGGVTLILHISHQLSKVLLRENGLDFAAFRPPSASRREGLAQAPRGKGLENTYGVAAADAGGLYQDVDVVGLNVERRHGPSLRHPRVADAFCGETTLARIEPARCFRCGSPSGYGVPGTR